MMKKVLTLIVFTVPMVGCLKTRNEAREVESRQVIQQQVVTMQKANADTYGKFSEVDENIRNLNGRLEIVENRLGQGQGQLDESLKGVKSEQADTQSKMALMQEALTRMETQILQLNAELQAMKAQGAARTAEKAAGSAKQGSFDVAEELFEQKDWKKAILNYQKYRDNNPKGKNLAEATYKMGVSFQELGMKDEAKTFYEEVAAKYPKSDQARKAKTRLKNLK